MLKFGIISEVYASKGYARVKFDDDGIVSAPLHISVPLSFQDQILIPFHVNQHVWCIMDDRCEHGVIAGAIYDETNVPAGGDPDIIQFNFQGGLSFQYNRNTKKLSVTGSGDIDVNINGNASIKCHDATIDSSTTAEIKGTAEVKITAPITEVSGILKAASIQTTGPGAALQIDNNGNISTTGAITGSQVKEGAIQLGTHKHTGVTVGGGISGTPTP